MGNKEGRSLLGVELSDMRFTHLPKLEFESINYKYFLIIHFVVCTYVLSGSANYN